MPYYQGLAGGGGGTCNTTGWATTSSSGSHLNPFFGSFGSGGGSGTMTSAATTTSVWFATATTNEYEWAGAQDQQQTLMQLYERDVSRYGQERANEYYHIMAAQAQAQARAARSQAEIDGEVRADAQAAMEAHQRLAKKQLATDIARARAKELLLSKLSPEQNEAFTKNGWFVVEGGKSKKKYRIRSNSYAGNIDMLNANDQVTHRLCVHCASDIPLEDHLLAQKIMLELAEDDIIKLANCRAA